MQIQPRRMSNLTNKWFHGDRPVLPCCLGSRHRMAREPRGSFEVSLPMTQNRTYGSFIPDPDRSRMTAFSILCELNGIYRDPVHWCRRQVACESASACDCQC